MAVSPGQRHRVVANWRHVEESCLFGREDGVGIDGAGHATFAVAEGARAVPPQVVEVIGGVVTVTPHDLDYLALERARDRVRMSLIWGEHIRT